jgi:hypothetical protein
LRKFLNEELHDLCPFNMDGVSCGGSTFGEDGEYIKI